MKVGIVGSGLVGSTAAYALVMQGIGREIVLVDKNEARARAEADDIRHAVPFAHPLTVRSGDYADLNGAKAVILTAGVGQRPGETRLDLLKRNAVVFEEVVDRVVEHAPGAVLVVATNPVDVMTQLATRYAARRDVPGHRVIGSGTTLDTARFRSLIGDRLGVDSHHVHAYVIGEHGDSEVLAWSAVTIGGMTLDEFAEMQKVAFDDAVRRDIDTRVRRAAYSIIEGKGATYYGIGSALARIVRSILSDQRSVLTITSVMPEVAGVKDVAVALPHIVGGAGLLATLPLPLADDEQQSLNTSARIIRDAIDSLG